LHRAWKAKNGNPVVDFGPFGQLLRVVGATSAASKRFSDRRKAES
jgi:hypothetical protein